MVHATLTTGCDLGRVPANAKFSGKSLGWWLYLSWIHPDGKSKKKAVLRFSCELLSIPLILSRTTNLSSDYKSARYHPVSSFLLLLAAEYHQRWEIENTIDEPKRISLTQDSYPFSQTAWSCPRDLRLALGHYAVRHLMFQAAQQAGISPLRLGLYWYA